MHGAHALKGCRLLWRKFPEQLRLLGCASCFHDVGQLSLQLRVVQIVEHGAPLVTNHHNPKNRKTLKTIKTQKTNTKTAQAAQAT